MFDNIVVFTQLVEIGSFNKTSEHLNIATSTLTRKIQELESYFNKLLLVRDTRNFKLTADGEALYQSFKDLRHELSNFYNKINPTDTSRSGQINVVLPVILSLELISPYINYFHQLYPNIKLNLFYQHREMEIKESVIDISITSHTPLNNSGDQKLLRTDLISLYCTPEYVNRYGLPTDINQLNGHNLIGGIGKDDEILDYLIFTNKYTNETTIYDCKKSSFKLNNLAHALKIGESGHHIFPCWDYFIEDLILSGDMIQVLPEYYVYKASFYIVTNKNKRPEEQIFIDFILKCMNKNINIDLINNEQKTTKILT